MARYTVHIPVDEIARDAALERSVFVQDGWSWSAFLFGALWLVWHRHWGMGLLVLVLHIALLFGLFALPIGEGARAGAMLLLAILWGLEGSSLRRKALSRAGYAEQGLVVGKDRDALEQRYFAEMDTEPAKAFTPQATVSGPSGPGQPQGIIGLFPDSRRGT
jgi:hypothetical protein